ncbi:MAG: DNA-3-methyladenine glycosylase [Deltaproteobacteria bacterium]|nr:DNA-3-methyladenine glycosylase [Deltaproteobacteria bacterium]
MLPEDFYRRDALEVARDVLGKLLVRDEVVLRVTEVEAYRHLPPPGDTANHCRFGRTARNAPMWGPPGRAYVYLIYGMHPMLNLVTGEEGQGEAVLVRAAEPVAGLETIVARRAWTRPMGPALLTGPGKVARALALDTSMSHHPLFEPGGLEVRDAPRVVDALAGPRIGIDYADEAHRLAPWRLADAGSAWVAQRGRLLADPSRIDRGRRPAR